MALVESEARPVDAGVSASGSVSSNNSICDAATSCASPAAAIKLTRVGPPPYFGPSPSIESLQCVKLDESQLAKIRSLRATVDSMPVVEEIIEKAPAEKEKGWLSGLFSRSSSSSIATKGEVTSLTWEEVLWLANDMVLWRYLRSYSWDEEQSLQQLMQTVWWRRNRKPHHVRPEDVMETAARGSVYRKGFDVNGHPIVYFK